MTNKLAVCAVTVIYRSDDVIGDFLYSLRHASSGAVPTIVVNNSPELPVDIDADWAAVLQSGANLGYGGGMNAGVAQVPESEWLLLANPDLTFAPGALDEMLRVADSDARIGVVGPLIRTPSGEIYPSARQLPSIRTGIGHAIFARIWRSNPWTASYLQDFQHPPVQRDAGWLSGSCLLVRRAVFDQVHGFDERYFMYFEDVDLCERISARGWRVVYAPSAEIQHEGGHSTRTASRKMIYEHHRSAYLYLASHYPGPAHWHLRVAFRTGLWIRSKVVSS